MINDALEATQEPRGLASTLNAECATWLRPQDIVLARGDHWPLRREFQHAATLVSNGARMQWRIMPKINTNDLVEET